MTLNTPLIEGWLLANRPGAVGKLAKKSGYSESAIEMFRRGKRFPRDMQRLADAIDRNPQELILFKPRRKSA